MSRLIDGYIPCLLGNGDDLRSNPKELFLFRYIRVGQNAVKAKQIIVMEERFIGRRVRIDRYGGEALHIFDEVIVLEW
jgi:hypothetical protein